MTPAQASGLHPFIDSFGPGGPTDRGQREADCRYAETLPTRPGCTPCEGVLPPWLSTASGILGERIAFGGRVVRGFY